MTQLSFEDLLSVLEQDRRFLEQLLEAGVVAQPLERAYTEQEAEEVRVARVLVRELDVNLNGVEVILHMRQQILGLRQQMEALVARVRQSRGG